MKSPRSALYFDEATIVWRDITCRVIEEKCFRNNPGWSRIEIRVVSPAGHPLPIAEEGSLRLELDQDEVKSAGGVAVYFTAWLEREAGNERYKRALAKWRQGDLFRGFDRD